MENGAAEKQSKILMQIKQKEDHIWALGLTAVLCICIGIFFDYYYELNDDLLIESILSGAYTGTPESRCIMLRFPLSFLLSLLYRMAPNLHWYGLFLCACNFGCIYLLTNRLLSFFHKIRTKAAAVLLIAGLIIMLLLIPTVFAQFTKTSGLLAATAAFLFYTTDSSGTVKDFFRRNVLSIVLVMVAFWLRWEMLLLMLPLICVTGLCRWACEKPFFTKENAAKYFSVLGGILAAVVLSQGIHMAAYGSKDWQQFNRFCDSRAELYDILWEWRPPYEGNEAFYESIGMTRSSQWLIETYNYALDENIDDNALRKIVDSARAQRKEQAPFADTLKKAAAEYVSLLFHDSWNLFCIALYAMVLFAALGNKHFRFLWELACLALVRTGLWMFILYRGRVVTRVTHCLYYMEFAILFAFLLVECMEKRKNFVYIKAGFMGILAMACLYKLGDSVELAWEKYVAHEQTNEEWEAFQTYIKDNPENFYLMETYSYAFYTGKMFADNEMVNFDIMGGWISKSPLTAKKFAYWGIESAEKAILEKENTYVINDSGDLSWLVNYYAEKGIAVSVQRIDSITAMDGRELLTVSAVTAE